VAATLVTTPLPATPFHADESIAPAHARAANLLKYLTLLTAGALLTLQPLASTASAQRVQFPTAAPAAATPYSATPYNVTPVPATGVPPTTYATPQTTPSPYAPSPYAQPSYTTPQATSPYAQPSYTTPQAAPSPYTQPTYATPQAAPSPYAQPSYAQPQAAPTTPYPATPYTPSPYAAPSVGPPPLFDPYSSGSTIGSSPATAPYSYTPPGTTAPTWPGQTAPQPYNNPYALPPPASAYPQQPGSLYPDGSPVQWQPGTYGTEGEGYWVKTQRLVQELSFEYTYIYGKHERPDDLEINRAELSSTFAIPILYNIDTPLLVTPGFASNWLEGPLADPTVPGEPDLPPRLYDSYLDFAWYPRVNQWLGGELGVRTGVWSDMDHVSTDSIRLLGRGLASVSLTPQLDILFGAVYLDRLRVKFLPAGGLYWRPTPEWDCYVVFPNPKVRKYFTSVGNSKWFWYVAGEYGGGSWTLNRRNPEIADRIDINDIRVIGGLEWETQTMIRGHVEAGYVWNRELLFESGDPGEFSLQDTVMVRGGIDF
jgi:hypothetical protein